jgi:hypothetical protein
VFVAAPVSSPAAEQEHAPNYSGDLRTRSTMTGDWGGAATTWGCATDQKARP